MKIQLSDHFTYGRILRFVSSSITMMIFTSIYSVVDGYFVSNYAGKAAFAAVNFIFPIIMLFTSAGFVFGSGGSALIGKYLGEQKKERANDVFSLITYSALIVGVILMVLGYVTLPMIAKIMGGEGEMLENAVTYSRIYILSTPFVMIQYTYQTLFITAEKPKLGLFSTILSGITNMVLDFLFVGIFHWGIKGAAVATALSIMVGGIFPLAYFSINKGLILRLGRTSWNLMDLWQTCTNGISELLSNITMSVVGVLYNIQLLKYAGENGIAAYGVLMYVSMIFLAIFIGYSMGTAPIISYHFGAQNHEELKSLFRKSMLIILISSICMVLLALAIAEPLAILYTGYDEELLALTKQAFFYYSFSFLFSGFAIYASSFFTALNDGVTSAIISFLRTVVFQVISVLIFPLLWGIIGIWCSVIFSEGASVLVSAYLILKNKNKFHYL